MQGISHLFSARGHLGKYQDKSYVNYTVRNAFQHKLQTGPFSFNNADYHSLDVTIFEKNLVYIVLCSKNCDFVYVGETGLSLNTRFMDHKYTINHAREGRALIKHFCYKSTKERCSYENDLVVRVIDIQIVNHIQIILVSKPMENGASASDALHI